MNRRSFIGRVAGLVGAAFAGVKAATLPDKPKIWGPPPPRFDPEGYVALKVDTAPASSALTMEITVVDADGNERALASTEAPVDPGLHKLFPCPEGTVIHDVSLRA